MVEFLHLLCRNEKCFCVGVTLFYKCILLKTSSSEEFVKWLFKNILTKTHSQNRRNLNGTNLQTRSTGSENSVSVVSWHVQLRKCRIPFLK